MLVEAAVSCRLPLLIRCDQQRDFTIRDAVLTEHGREQANLLHIKLAGNLEREVELVVTSPLRRTLQTTLGAFPDAIERLDKENVVVFPYAQEASDRTSPGCLPTYDIG